MRRRVVFIVLLITSTVVAGCGNGGGRNLAGKLDDLEKRVRELEGNVTDRTTIAVYELADIDLEQKGYSRIVNQFGWFPVLVRRIEKYHDGHVISMSIGNPSNATFHGFSLTVRYGKDLDRETTIDSKTDLRPGQFTSFDFLVVPSAPEDIRRMRVGIGFSDVSLAEG